MTTSEDWIAEILLVEDDPVAAQVLTDSLQVEGYRVWHAGSALEAERLLRQVHPDLIITDLMLPDENGLVLCAELKAKVNAPVLVCSATKRKEDLKLAFKLGADDFFRKPYNWDEVQIRVGAALRRSAVHRTAASRNVTGSAEISGPNRIGSLRIDQARCRVTLGGRGLHLTPTEYRLLCALASRPNEVLSREELAQGVWGYHDFGTERTLDVHMRRLRAKLSAEGAAAPSLITVRGFGYKLSFESDDVSGLAQN
ncbi:MAG: response regulator transcription factor [Chloroflexi bacterium]|nr:response regulator transcription factor [Chloroflexota bacterium]